MHLTRERAAGRGRRRLLCSFLIRHADPHATNGRSCTVFVGAEGQSYANVDYAAANASVLVSVPGQHSLHDIDRFLASRAARACIFAVSSCMGMSLPRP